MNYACNPPFSCQLNVSCVLMSKSKVWISGHLYEQITLFWCVFFSQNVFVYYLTFVYSSVLPFIVLWVFLSENYTPLCVEIKWIYSYSVSILKNVQICLQKMFRRIIVTAFITIIRYAFCVTILWHDYKRININWLYYKKIIFGWCLVFKWFFISKFWKKYNSIYNTYILCNYLNM